MNIDFQSIATYGTFLFMGISAIALATGGWRDRKSSDQNQAEQTITLLKENAAALEAKTKGLLKTIADMETATKAQIEEKDRIIFQLNEQIKAKDQIIEKYELIFQGKNPELESFMKSMTHSMSIVERSIETLLRLHQTSSFPVTVNNNSAPQ